MEENSLLMSPLDFQGVYTMLEFSEIAVFIKKLKMGTF